jgi:hypothetical protein
MDEKEIQTVLQTLLIALQHADSMASSTHERLMQTVPAYREAVNAEVDTALAGSETRPATRVKNDIEQGSIEVSRLLARALAKGAL